MADRGFRGASIKRIAERAGLKSPALIYWYFKDKQALFEAMLDEMAPFTGLLDGIERKLRRHPLIEYGHDASRLVRERATCRVNAPNGRVMRPDAPTP